MKCQVLHLAVYVDDDRPDPETAAWRSLIPGSIVKITAEPVLQFPPPGSRPALDTAWDADLGYLCTFTTSSGVKVQLSHLPGTYDVIADFGAFSNVRVDDPERFGPLPETGREPSKWLAWCGRFSQEGAV